MNGKNKRWTTLDITWFTGQLIVLSIINIFLIITYDSLAIAIMSLFASLFGVVGTYLAVKKYNINYLFGTIHVILYGLIAFSTKVYGDFMLNIFIFLPLDIIGWILWNKNSLKLKNIDDSNKIEIDRVVNALTLNQWIISIVVLIISTLLYAWLLHYLDDPAPILDSLSTTISIFGMWLMVGYYREQWWVWLIVNIVSVGIWIQVLFTGELVSIVFITMWSIYTVNSIIGIKRWNK